MLTIAQEAHLREEIWNPIKLLIHKVGGKPLILTVEKLFSIAANALRQIGVPASVWWDEKAKDWVLEVEFRESRVSDSEITKYWDALNAAVNILDEHVVASRWGQAWTWPDEDDNHDRQHYCVFGQDSSTEVKL